MKVRKTNTGRGAARRRGFTLIEAALVTVIIGVGVVGMLQLLAAGTMSNSASTELTTGLNLANNVREMTQDLTFEQIEALDGTTYSPPVDARGNSVDDFANWTQRISFRYVDPNYLASDSVVVTSSPMARVRVAVERNGATVCEINWLVVKVKETF